MKQTLAIIALLSAVQAGNPAKVGVKLAHETHADNKAAVHLEAEFNHEAAEYNHIDKIMFQHRLDRKERDVLRHEKKANMDHEEADRLHADYLDHQASEDWAFAHEMHNKSKYFKEKSRLADREEHKYRHATTAADKTEYAHLHKEQGEYKDLSHHFRHEEHHAKHYAKAHAKHDHLRAEELRDRAQILHDDLKEEAEHQGQLKYGDRFYKDVLRHKYRKERRAIDDKMHDIAKKWENALHPKTTATVSSVSVVGASAVTVVGVVAAAAYMFTKKSDVAQSSLTTSLIDQE